MRLIPLRGIVILDGQKIEDIFNVSLLICILKGFLSDEGPLFLVRPAWACAIGCKSRTSPDSGNR